MAKRSKSLVVHKRTGVSKYRPEYVERAANLALAGCTYEQIGVACGEVDRTTITDWKKKYPAFRKALEAAEHEAAGKVARSLFQRATGEVTQTTTRSYVNRKGVKVIERSETTLPGDVRAAETLLRARMPEQFGSPDRNGGIKVGVQVNNNGQATASDGKGRILNVVNGKTIRCQCGPDQGEDWKEFHDRKEREAAETRKQIVDKLMRMRRNMCGADNVVEHIASAISAIRLPGDVPLPSDLKIWLIETARDYIEQTRAAVADAQAKGKTEDDAWASQDIAGDAHGQPYSQASVMSTA